MPAPGAGPGSPSGTGGPGSLGGSGMGSKGGSSGSGSGKGGLTAPKANPTISKNALASGEGKGGGAPGHGGQSKQQSSNSQTLSSPAQNNAPPSVAPSQITAPISVPSTSGPAPSTAIPGSIPAAGSPIIGFPNNGNAGPDAANFDLLELAELLQNGYRSGFPAVYGDIGAEFTDDPLTFRAIAEKARLPLLALAAFAGLGFLAWKAI